MRSLEHERGIPRLAEGALEHGADGPADARVVARPVPAPAHRMFRRLTHRAPVSVPSSTYVRHTRCAWASSNAGDDTSRKSARWTPVTLSCAMASPTDAPNATGSIGAATRSMSSTSSPTSCVSYHPDTRSSRRPRSSGAGSRAAPATPGPRRGRARRSPVRTRRTRRSRPALRSTLHAASQRRQARVALDGG